MERNYPIGTPGEPWSAEDKQRWFEARIVERSYRDEVLSKLDGLDDSFSMAQYGSLSIDPERYPLMAVTVKSSNPVARWALVTGGVHGYETSGVQGAIKFLETTAPSYRDQINLLVVPCVSPWGYEVINRWNPFCVDPNRSFCANSSSEEAAALMGLVANSKADFVLHLDLHETTDSDETEFRPATAARDGKIFAPGTIPDGFYTVGDSENPQPEFQAAIIAGVERVAHIAPADDGGQLIGEDIVARGVINYRYREWGLCAGLTNATFTTTTEVYPDSPKATDASCIEAQIAAVQAGLEFVLEREAGNG